MKKIFISFFLLLTSVLAQAQLQDLPLVLRASKVNPVVLHTNNGLSQRLSRLISQTFQNRSYYVPLSLSAPLSPQQAVDVSQQLFSRAQMNTFIWKTPQIEPLEQNLPRFLFTVSAKKKSSPVLGTGFVFATQEEGKTYLWGATTASVAAKAGKNVYLTFQIPGYEQPFSFPAQVLMQSRSGNIALLKVPQEISHVALPVQLDTSFPSDNYQNVLAYGLAREGDFYKGGHSIFFGGTERLLGNAPETNLPQIYSGGFVVNAQGKTIGLYNRSYSIREFDKTDWFKANSPRWASQPDYVSEFIPARQLTFLLKEYHSPHSAARVILFGGVRVGKMAVDETISHILIYYADQSLKRWDRTPLWSLDHLEEFIDIKDAQKVIFFIEGGEQGSYRYVLDLPNHTSTKITPSPKKPKKR